MHWINALAMFIMIGSGWKIYNDEVLFGWLHFPDWMTIGGEAQGALQWHFFAMWILMLNGLAYLIYGLATGRFRRMLFPIRPSEVIANIRDALRLPPRHDDITRYNAVQKLLYVGIILVGIVQVLSGLAIWKPVQFSELAALFGELPERAAGRISSAWPRSCCSCRACRAGAAGAADARSPCSPAGRRCEPQTSPGRGRRAATGCRHASHD